MKSNQYIANEEEIKNTVIGAIKIYEKIVFPPKYTKSPDIVIPQEVIDKKVQEVTSECYKYFSSKDGWLENRINAYKSAVFAAAYPYGEIRTTEYRLKQIKFLEINITGDTAKVVADAYIVGKSVLCCLDESKISSEDSEKLNNINIYKSSDMGEQVKKKKEIEDLVKKLPKKTEIVDASGITRYYYTLIKENGKWKITSESLYFIDNNNANQN
ncbi:hypothetical protein [Caldicellulosiruptor danielii]|uniref:NTF2 fold immunity protein domain-containing protein n=1 Tax=Anaerocellum danielii TaxID=1387557 RepID=A0ABZ0U1H2_9FIRM|nr:hypothetical protein [Caldicellulosiruptor danielii]WPX09322.1 hypothetical protein SOJ16_000523 [Caldicellulosiruptor danielii]